MTDERLITSLTNDTVKAVRALHMRKGREQTGLFLAEGLKFIGEALDQGRTPQTLLVGMEARPHPLLDRAKAETIRAGGEVEVGDRDPGAFAREQQGGRTAHAARRAGDDRGAAGDRAGAVGRGAQRNGGSLKARNLRLWSLAPSSRIVSHARMPI